MPEATMSKIPGFTGKFRAQKHTQPTSSARLNRRPRESAVCKQCRTSKLRCDRGQPACGNCVKKGSTEECDYDHSVNLGPAIARYNIAEERLAHLESLVKDLMHNQSVSKSQHVTSAQPMTPEELPKEHPISQGESHEIDHGNYVGFTHWSAVLDEIDGLKADLSTLPQFEEETQQTRLTTGDLCEESIFGSPGTHTLQQVIVDHLPPKFEADNLLTIHFQGENFILPFIHVYHFRSQYEQFWSNTKNVNPLWLSILFSIFYRATLVRPSVLSGGQPGEAAFIKDCHFHAAAAKCLVIGRYHRPQEYVVEALLMYAHGKSASSLDPLRETGAIAGMAIRSAYQLGYHRDPDHFNTFTVFEGEMRRRSWAVCKQVDLMTSFQLGLPSSICLENCDTKTLRNLSDDDFGPDSQELPESRPDDQITRLSWFVVKERQMPSFAKVCRDALSFQERSEAQIQLLDQEVRKMHGIIPDTLKTRPLSESVGDAPFIVVTRIYLDFISLKSLCVLHRRYMARGNHFSTMACLDAGKRIVSQFIEIHRECAPGGRLHAEKWMLNCYTMNDFLLGTTVLCLYLHSRPQRAKWATNGDEVQESEVFNLLDQARIICVEKSDVSKDAQRVARIVMLTLQKATMAKDLSQFSRSLPLDASLTSSTCEPSLEATFGNPLHNGNMQWDDDPFGLLQPFSRTDDGMTDLDWAVFDPFMLSQNT